MHLRQVPALIDCSSLARLQIIESATSLGYQSDEMFLLKISQLRELFVVRWSVFLLGPAGCGKSAIWRTLMKAQNIFGEKTIYKPINPKVRLCAQTPLQCASCVASGGMCVRVYAWPQPCREFCLVFTWLRPHANPATTGRDTQ